MGFGNGTTTYHSDRAYDRATGERAQTILTNDMVAHTWNALSRTFGRSSNGNFYFKGRTLYSYGTHFPVAFIMPDGVAVINSDHASVSTSQHTSNARGASRDRRRVMLPALDDAMSGGLLALEILADDPPATRDGAARLRASIKSRLREYIFDNAAKLMDSYMMEPGEWDYGEWDETTRRYVRNSDGRESAGAYLTRVAGLPAASWPKIARDAAAAKARAERATARQEKARAEQDAKALAELPAGKWREYLRGIAESYHTEGSLTELAKRLYRAKRAGKAAGFSKRRLDSIRSRESQVREMIGRAAEIQARAHGRKALRAEIAAVRQAARVFRSRLDSATFDSDLQSAAFKAADAAAQLKERKLFPFATRRRLAIVADRAKEAAELCAATWKALETERREREERQRAADMAEQRRAWLAGEQARLFRHFDAETGGAALRIYGDKLQTSHGAEVPLADAIRVFRFVKLVRERGEGWKRNGARVPVGSFQVDSIEPSGDMIAGCHAFTWPEIERAAKLADVAELPASADAETRKAH